MRLANLGPLLLLAALPVLTPAAFADDRVALVVGNATYAHIGALANPANDAADMSAVLARLGFEVTTVRDAGRVAMTEALRVFTRESAGADVSLVFYAGHGLEMDGVNYLVPIDAQLERDTDVRFEAVVLDDVLAATEGAGLRVVILDACRNNPLARSMQRTSARRSVSRGSFGDLDETLLGDETLVAYAAAAGTTAADGTGRNSPYTAALLTFLEQPLELTAVFRQVRARVLEATAGEQRPHEYASLLGEHYLSRAFAAAAPAAAPVALGGATAAARLQQENLFWESIRDSTNPADFEAYLRQFPAGVYQGLATNRLAELRPAAAPDPLATRPADPVDPETFRDCPLCPEMVVIPAGTFRMGCVSGSDCLDNELPVHEVEVASFALSKYEVTRGQFAAFVAASGHDTPGGCTGWGAGSWRNKGWQNDDHPVTCVNWADAQAYLRWLSQETGARYRLPSESEWEYAARAGTTTAFFWGDYGAQERCDYANGYERSDYGCDDGWDRTAPVGSFAANGFGLHDMAGNVLEWVCSHGTYGAPRDASVPTPAGDCGPLGLRFRVARGGYWGSYLRGLRSAERGMAYAEHREAFNGFRVVRMLD